MEVAIIGGAGTVGSTTAYTLAVERPEIDITLVDVAEDAARGHSIDIRHGRSFPMLPQFGTGGPLGSITAGPSDSASLSEADVAIVTASVPRPPNSAKRGGRAAFLDRNLELARSIAAMLREHEPMPVVVVSNPVDRITDRIWRETGWDRSYVMGYSLSETARAADKIATIRDVPASEVYCPLAGEHGEHVVPLFSRLTIGGEPTTLTDTERATVRDYVRDVPYDVIELRGAEETSRWVTGQGVTRVICGLVDDGLDGEPIALSVPLEGEYGLSDVCLSVPIELCEDGVDTVLEWELPPDELDALHEAAASIRADVETNAE
ncbi:MAG: malate dehydrogenase [Halobacteriota archaeon]